jgi:hypothetical protein
MAANKAMGTHQLFFAFATSVRVFELDMVDVWFAFLCCSHHALLAGSSTVRAEFAQQCLERAPAPFNT